CSLCMGNQARVRDNTTVVSTSTRNFNNRMGNGSKVFLSSAEVAAITAQLGKLPTVDEYMTIMSERITPKADNVYKYLNFHEIPNYEQNGGA
ncbi:MAG: aconitate hydratase B, partial [Magnetococcales bacterium]|nr:aconitate hydratase B [Magnetococcales bacterium]